MILTTNSTSTMPIAPRSTMRMARFDARTTVSPGRVANVVGTRQ